MLALDRSNGLSLAGAISGSGGLAQLGAGTTTLTGTSSYSGATDVFAGLLAVNGSIANSAVLIHSGGTLAGSGSVGATTNQAGGIIAPGNSIDILTIAGNYIGVGGTLEIEAVLGDDSSLSDLLRVTGNTSGTTNVKVINAGGSGAPIIEGIKIVEVSGASNGIFSLLGDYVFEGEQAVVAGAYGYRLYKNGIATPADGDWYLRSSLRPTDPGSPADPGTPGSPGTPESPGVPGEPGAPADPLYQPGAPLYEAYADVLQSFNRLDSLQQRVGNRSWTNGVIDDGILPEAATPGRGIWGRIVAGHISVDPKSSTAGADYDSATWQLQVGSDGLLYSGADGRLVGGLSARYGTISAGVASVFGVGAIGSTAYGLSSTLTWYGNAGFYLDGQANLTWYDSNLFSTTAGTGLVSGNDGFGYAVGIEAGQQIALGPNWSITPQAQLTYSALGYDDFIDSFGAIVSPLDGGSLRGRFGLSADYQNSWIDETGQTSRMHAYGIANIYYDFLPKSEVDLAGVKLTSMEDPLWGGLGLGGSYSWADGKYAIHGEATLNTSLGNFGASYDVTGTAGFGIRF